MRIQSTVIKAGDAGRHAGRLDVFNLGDIQAEADAIIERARAEAESVAVRIRETAVKRAAELFEQRHREGYEQGFSRGLTAGREQALAEAKQAFQAEHASLAETMRATIERFEAEKSAWLSAVHRDAVELALEIARRVVKRVGFVDREVAVENLREVIDRVGHGRAVAVRVSPVDMEAIRAFAEALATAHEEWRHVRLVEDEAVEAGGCVVELEAGAVDATLATQLDRVAAELVPWRSGVE